MSETSGMKDFFVKQAVRGRDFVEAHADNGFSREEAIRLWIEHERTMWLAHVQSETKKSEPGGIPGPGSGRPQ